MRGDLRVGVERGAGVVQIRDVLDVEPPELIAPQHPLAGLNNAFARASAAAAVAGFSGVRVTAAIAARINAHATSATRTRVGVVAPPPRAPRAEAASMRYATINTASAR